MIRVAGECLSLSRMVPAWQHYKVATSVGYCVWQDLSQAALLATPTAVSMHAPGIPAIGITPMLFKCSIPQVRVVPRAVWLS